MKTSKCKTEGRALLSRARLKKCLKRKDQKQGRLLISGLCLTARNYRLAARSFFKQDHLNYGQFGEASKGWWTNHFYSSSLKMMNINPFDFFFFVNPRLHFVLLYEDICHKLQVFFKIICAYSFNTFKCYSGILSIGCHFIIHMLSFLSSFILIKLLQLFSLFKIE